MSKPERSEEQRLAQHLLEQEGDSLETRRNIEKHVLEDRKISHYECSWAYGGNPLVAVWEETREAYSEDEPEGSPDKIGCLVCGVMADTDEVREGELYLEAKQYTQSLGRQ